MAARGGVVTIRPEPWGARCPCCNSELEPGEVGLVLRVNDDGLLTEAAFVCPDCGEDFEDRTTDHLARAGYRVRLLAPPA